ncbi:Ribose ABC transporter, periplasmic ribose-binding protein RbsB [Serinicoccus hydrothermalis]|uniref:Ribose ABC transporter, periplasmic ribose-binding protein RbsB n=2 Tax=Serinicoccus hydrothermalis TaxID=1758689 RepID=A0A1B1NA79_9MICO|nr:substrate-binding domain-containing protein [Serinicoccus hydrothermalis]ANS78337.1 Ribose ABC transporter, periplasmic ribose-binding protein RbsB [Serinicoccus hydrothermalis]
MRTTRAGGTVAALSALALLAACSTDSSLDDPAVTESAEDDAAAEEGGDEGDAGGEEESSDEWFVQADYDTQDEQRSATFEGDPEQPYLQYIDGEMTDTSEFASEGAKKVCFANASISNPWRQTGWITMNEQLGVLQESGVISEMETRDAQDDDNTQIADIDYFIAEGNCDAFVISPNSTAAITPAVERACDTGKPVVVFDRGVETDCPTTFIHPIGGYAWGIDTAEFLSENLSEGDKVVALRILPGVDVLENRWAAAERIFEENGIEAVDFFTGADPAEIKSILSDELATGEVQGVWMDAGDGAVAAIEAFEDAGQDYPVMTGEDEMSFLRKWEDTGLTGLAPVYSNFQWRTPLLATEMIFAGEEVPTEWVLPQVPITEEERGDFLAANEGMPDGHYAKFGGEDLPGYPQVWQDRVIP